MVGFLRFFTPQVVDSTLVFFVSGQHWGLRTSNGKRKVSEFLSLLESVCLHPGKLTWNTKMEVWKMILLFLIVFKVPC